MAVLKLNRVIAVTALAIFASLPVLAANWETIADVKYGNSIIKAEVDKSSIKQIVEKGNKILLFTMRTHLEDEKNKADALTGYKVNCNSQEVWKTREDVKIQNKEQSVPLIIKTAKTQQLQGKDYYDFQDIMKIMCSRY